MDETRQKIKKPLATQCVWLMLFSANAVIATWARIVPCLLTCELLHMVVGNRVIKAYGNCDHVVVFDGAFFEFRGNFVTAIPQDLQLYLPYFTTPKHP
jgi:hypothetical protein